MNLAKDKYPGSYITPESPRIIYAWDHWPSPAGHEVKASANDHDDPKVMATLDTMTRGQRLIVENLHHNRYIHTQYGVNVTPAIFLPVFS